MQCKCRFESSVFNNKQRWNDDKCRCECKELIGKGGCNKGFIWHLNDCECECYKSCDFSEYLHYKKCKCKKRLVDKLAEECTGNIKETWLIEITSAKNENKHKCSAWTLHIVLFSIFLTINVGIGSYFLYFHWYLKKMLLLLNLVLALKQQFNELINGKSQNRDLKSNVLFFQRHNESQKFRFKLV